ncbi:MAG: M18 family aminopeptidase [Eubacteriales bacterium]|nr:M18 family aminopeptidase [Eubacteriales bacterium]
MKKEKDKKKEPDSSAVYEINKELLDFIKQSPCSFQAAEALRNGLLGRGFQELSEGERWSLSAGDYFVMRNHSAIIAFTIPEGGINAKDGARIAASHADSPSFKIKENPEISVEGQYVTLNVERYGGMICAPWFDRPLSAAGRVFVKDKRMKNGVREVLVNLDRDMLLIPNVAIHMNRKVNEGYSYNAQVDMLPLYALGKADGGFMKLIAKAAGVKPEQILGHDLFLYNRTEGMIWGPEDEFVSAPRLDDLQCAFSTMRGFLSGERKKHLSLCCVFDNEEVGSETRQGAGSTFLYDTLQRVTAGLGLDYEDYLVMLGNSFMVSADNAHAVHPNHKEFTDPTNRPYIGGGIVIKYNAQQRYCTDGYSAAFFKEICDKAGVKYQSFVNRSDILGGSTLGNISNTKVAVSSADIGLPQLAMHSPYETAGTKDTAALVKAMTVFYE